VRLPGRTVWSGLWACAVGCFLLALLAWWLAPTTNWLGGSAVLAVFGVTFALLGVWQTRLNRSRMRGAEPLVHKTHAYALYCRACECVYFDTRKLPAGILPGKPMPAAEYRRRLWYACGFTKPI